MKKYFYLVFIIILFSACSKPMIKADISQPNRFYKKTFNSDKSDIYDAIKFALKANGFSVMSENKSSGYVESSWVPVRSGSHYIRVFGRDDYGVTGAFQQIIANVSDNGGSASVSVGTRTKSLVAYLKSSGVEERKILDQISNYLRKHEPEITNIGVE